MCRTCSLMRGSQHLPRLCLLLRVLAKGWSKVASCLLRARAAVGTSERCFDEAPGAPHSKRRRGLRTFFIGPAVLPIPLRPEIARGSRRAKGWGSRGSGKGFGTWGQPGVETLAPAPLSNRENLRKLEPKQRFQRKQHRLANPTAQIPKPGRLSPASLPALCERERRNLFCIGIPS